MHTKFINLIIGLGTVGLGWYFLGLIGRFTPLPSLSLASLIIYFSLKNYKINLHLPPERFFLSILSLQIITNAFGLLVPEVSFDAIWYHLPEAQIYALTGKITQIPELIYSTMPRLGEVLFASGFWFPFAAGPKLISYIFYLLFIIIIYRLGRLYLDRSQALFFTIAVNSFNLIAWQSTAGYVDILRSLFELSSIYCLIQFNRRPQLSWLIQAGVLTGFALSVKMQSLIGLIASLIFILTSQRKNIIFALKSSLLYLIFALILSFPWYYDNYIQSAHPLYPLNNPVLQQNLYSHSGTANLFTWISSQTAKIIFLPFKLSLAPESQLSPLILILLPLLFLSYKFLFLNHKSLIFFITTFIFLWWYLPPPETRYALTGIILLLLLEFIALFKSKPSSKLIPIATRFILIAVLINFSIRLVVTYQNLPVILGTQSHQEYIESHTSDFNRDKMEKYYSNYWLNLVNFNKLQ